MKKSGFSLIEVLLGIFILAIVLSMVCKVFIENTVVIRDNIDEIRGRTTINSVQCLTITESINDGWNIFNPIKLNGYSVGRALFRSEKNPDQEIIWIWQKENEQSSQIVNYAEYNPVKGDVLISWSGYIYYIQEDNESPNIRPFESSSNFLVLRSRIVLVKAVRWYNFARKN